MGLLNNTGDISLNKRVDCMCAIVCAYSFFKNMKSVGSGMYSSHGVHMVHFSSVWKPMGLKCQIVFYAIVWIVLNLYLCQDINLCNTCFTVILHMKNKILYHISFQLYLKGISFSCNSIGKLDHTILLMNILQIDRTFHGIYLPINLGN